MDDNLDLLNPSAAPTECDGERDGGPDDDPDSDDAFVKVQRGEDDEFDGEVIQSWTWTGDALQATFDTAQDAMGAVEGFYDQDLEWWEEDEDCWYAERPGCRMTESWRDPDEDDNDGDHTSDQRLP